MLGKLLDGTECQLLLDTGASKSIMSKSFYMYCKSLHSLSKFASRTQKNSGRKWSVCQCIVCNSSNYRLHRHRFEIYTLVSEIHENVDLVLGIKNIFELEGVIKSQNS